jgi:hypothetical protein
LKVWNTVKSVYRNEIARTSFLKAKLLAKMGENEQSETALREATRLRAELVPNSSKPVRELVEEDFDQLVTFWSR